MLEFFVVVLIWLFVILIKMCVLWGNWLIVLKVFRLSLKFGLIIIFVSNGKFDLMIVMFEVV